MNERPDVKRQRLKDLWLGELDFVCNPMEVEKLESSWDHLQQENQRLDESLIEETNHTDRYVTKNIEMEEELTALKAKYNKAIRKNKSQFKVGMAMIKKYDIAVETIKGVERLCDNTNQEYEDIWRIVYSFLKGLNNDND